MGFRFQKRIKIIPGITLNLSKKGFSTSFGVTGARATLGHGQTRTTLGLPGTGLSHTTVRKNAAKGSLESAVPHKNTSFELPNTPDSMFAGLGAFFKGLIVGLTGSKSTTRR